MIILLISFLILSFTFPFYISPVYASNETYYARVNSDDVFLYKSAVDLTECENVLFILPKTYFVRLTADENSMFYRAEYLGVSGYVKKDSVQVIVGTPTTPYMDNINFRIYAELSRDMRSLPTTNGSNQITYIPLYSRNLTYYGEVVGETLISGRTNKWYYCKYSAGEDFYGYVYSDFCDELPKTMPENNEEVVYSTTPPFQKLDIKEEKSLPVKSKTTGIVIAILTLPAIIFAIMIFKNKTILGNSKSSKKEIIDY
ncbi:MAG: hypothetical protein E7374_03720 [Clostridiales bacterium]|nr:hypothetical protein [Clostridiales bacterium]